MFRHDAIFPIFRDKDEESEILQGLTEIESVFMKSPNLFLRLIIGNISVTLPYKEDRFVNDAFTD